MYLTALTLSSSKSSPLDCHLLSTTTEAISSRKVVDASFGRTLFLPLHVICNLRSLKQSPSSSVTVRSANYHGHRSPFDGEQLVSSDHDYVHSGSNLGDESLSSFIRMLGLDNEPLDREQAIYTLWKYSLGGKQCVDSIMQFPGCLNLVVNLLKSESRAVAEAASGLLRVISSFNVYQKSVAESGAIEAITALLGRKPLDADVKEQSLCFLRNFSTDEAFRSKIANEELLPLLIRSLGDEVMKVKEASGSVLSILAMSKCNHQMMVESGVIPKLANILKISLEGSKVIRKEAKNALLELAKDDYYKLLIMEEGLILVPLVGWAAYKSFRSLAHSWPSLPDGTKFERKAKGPSKYGASELLLGLSYDRESLQLDEFKVKSKIAQTQQQFLVRVGAIEAEYGQDPKSLSPSNPQFTLLPMIDGVARLCLILELEDESAISKAARAIADASISDEVRILFKEAGAVRHLIHLLDISSGSVKIDVISALEKLSFSTAICEIIESEGALRYLYSILKHAEISGILMDKTLNILVRILNPDNRMKMKFYDGSSNRVHEESGAMTPAATNSDMILDKEIGVIRPVESTTRSEVFDSATSGRLVQILKFPSPDLQRKSALLLEYITLVSSSPDSVISSDIESALYSVFHIDPNPNSESQPHEIAETGLAVASAARLLSNLLELERFRISVDQNRLSISLRKVLQSDIDLHSKNPVAASLVKLGTLLGPNSEDSIETDVVICETIPRLLERIRELDGDSGESDVVELSAIISHGVEGSARAITTGGGIFPLVKLVGQGSDRVAQAALEILYALSMDEENHPAFIVAGAPLALRKYVLSERSHWMLALRILRVLPTS